MMWKTPSANRMQGSDRTTRALHRSLWPGTVVMVIPGLFQKEAFHSPDQIPRLVRQLHQIICFQRDGEAMYRWMHGTMIQLACICVTTW